MSTMMGGAPTIFECPNCGETIDASADACRFCGTTVDRPLALHRAMILAKVNRACSDAIYVRTCALAVPVFFVLRLMPFFSFVGLSGFIGLSFAVPIWATVWWTRFGNLESSDSDYVRSRKAVRFAGLVIAAVLLVFVIAPFVYGIVYSMIRATHPTS